MSLLMDAAPKQAMLFGAVLLLGVWAAATGNLDMGWMSSALLIGP